MSRDSEQERKYLVLNISKGLRFNCFKNVVLRIAPVFQKQRLTSKYVLAKREANFNVYFMWCTTARHINLLQRWCSNIEIAVCAISADKTWTAGCAMIGIQHAQVLGPDVKLSTQRFPVYNMRMESRMMRRPELVVTLSIRSEPPFNISPLYSANLTESSRPLSPVDKMVRSFTSSAKTKTKKSQEEESQDSLNLLSQPYAYQKQKIMKNRNGSPNTKACHSGSRYKVLPPDEKLVLDLQRSLQIKTALVPSQTTFKLVSKIPLGQDQKMYKNVREPQETKDCNDNKVQTTCSSTETEQEVPKSNDCTPTLPNNMRIPSKFRLIDQNTDTSKMASLGIYGSSSTFKMIGQPDKSHYRTPTLPKLPNSIRIPSKFRLIVQKIDRSKMASLGVYGSSSIFQMIGEPPPTRKPGVYIQKSHDSVFVPLEKYMNIFKSRKATSTYLMLTKPTRTEEEKIEIQKSHDQTPAPLQRRPCKSHVKVKKSVRFKEDIDMKQC